jgi:hypothetical protein
MADAYRGFCIKAYARLPLPEGLASIRLPDLHPSGAFNSRFLFLCGGGNRGADFEHRELLLDVCAFALRTRRLVARARQMLKGVLAAQAGVVENRHSLIVATSTR